MPTPDEQVLIHHIAEALLSRNETLATAESCTGGLIGHTLTNVSGSSQWYMGGVIAYHNDAKTSLLGVDVTTLAMYGAVSAQVATQMAQGIRKALHTDWGIGVTGIAGPSGGTEAKPVGLVYVGISGLNIDVVIENCFSGSRNEIKTQTVKKALSELVKQFLDANNVS